MTSLIYIKALNKCGIEHIARATSGEDAIATYQKDPVDIVFMDICLAGEMNGIEAARRIQTIGSPRIIFITGYKDQATEQEAETLNPAGIFTKPVDFSKILASL